MSQSFMNVASLMLAPAGCTLSPADLDTRSKWALRDMSAILGAKSHLRRHELQLRYRVGDRKLELVGELVPPRQLSLFPPDSSAGADKAGGSAAVMLAERDKLVEEAQRAPSRIHRMAQAVAAAISRGEMIPAFKDPGDRELWETMCANGGRDLVLDVAGEQMELAIPRLPKRFADVDEHRITGLVKDGSGRCFVLERVRDIGKLPAARRQPGKRQFQVDLSPAQILGGISILAAVARDSRMPMELRARAALDVASGEVIGYDLIEVTNKDVLFREVGPRVRRLEKFLGMENE